MQEKISTFDHSTLLGRMLTTRPNHPNSTNDERAEHTGYIQDSKTFNAGCLRDIWRGYHDERRPRDEKSGNNVRERTEPTFKENQQLKKSSSSSSVKEGELSKDSVRSTISFAFPFPLSFPFPFFLNGLLSSSSSESIVKSTGLF